MGNKSEKEKTHPPLKKMCWSCLGEKKLFAMTEKGKMTDDVIVIDCPKCTTNKHE